ncbi:MAG: exodeoxyribonuclease V subunit gamma [Syntrophorhabdaceae bacterium]|nr:exodeoxyribonuclease V subunit gamma [Syntrophorhabdaceae bacterium]
MPGLKIYHGNRLEILVDALASVLEKPLSSPFKPEIIVVQSKGMERWLSMELAERFGVWANFMFPFPDNFVWEMFKRVTGKTPDMELFSPPNMAWHIMEILSVLKDIPEFEEIQQYIYDNEIQLKTFQLSEQIANVFDRYTVYRHEMIYRWHKQNPTDWQQILWHHLIKGNEEKNRVFILYDFLEEIGRKGFCIEENKLPERISVFGISALPDYHLKVIKAISRIIDVHLFFLNPTYKYWGDIVPEGIVRKKDKDELHLETGNPLLASMGKMGRDFFDALIDDMDEEYELFCEFEAHNLLTAIQSDIFHLVQRGKDTERTLISDDDISIQIHSCHSALREIEVLHNNLLFLFEKYKDLKPKDILVMTPDIEAYAPFISAVFDAHYGEKEWIPYSIADRKASSENPVVSLFLKILNLFVSRFYASDIMDVLDDALIKEKFKLNETDIVNILKWINDINIRWGIDEFHRRFLDNPAFKENSWKAGIERLLLGYAMFSKDGELFKGILPYDEMEGDYVDTLKKFLDFLFPLFDYSKKMTIPRQLDDWSDILMGILDTFIVVNDETERYIQFIRQTVLNLKKITHSYGFEMPVSFHVILYYLKARLSIREYTTGFITGGVTFCEMLPMRSIPFKVIALIGMNNDAFPRPSRHTNFDLMGRFPRRGDRSLRDEDRYIFLEAILSARLCLYISYTGQSIKDGSLIPPSVVVSELIDYIEKGFYHRDKHPFEIIWKKHPIQSFSPKYFHKDSLIFNYSKEDYDTALTMLKKKYKITPFFVRALKDRPVEIKHITNGELKSFFRHPVKYFFHNRLGIFLEEIKFTLDDDEPIEFNNLDEFKIKERLIESLVSLKDLDKTKKTIHAEGILPPAIPGRVLLDNVSVRAESFYKKIQRYLTDKEDPIDFIFEWNNMKINVTLNNIYSYGLVKYRPSKDIKAKYLIEMWIDHLFFNLLGEGSSIFLSTKKEYIFRPVGNAKDLIIKLLNIYNEGMKSPIKLFPETSYTYMKQLKKKDHWDALKSAKDIWEKKNFYREPEGDDPYYYACFKDTDPLDEAFIRLSKEVFGPLIEAIK